MIIEDIWQKVKDIEYNLWDIRTDSIMSEENQMDDEYFYKYYRLSNPHQMEERMVGTCWDQAMYVAYLAKENYLDYSYIFVNYEDGGTHTFACINYLGDWYHIESADGNYLGVHGPYKDIDEAIKYFKESSPSREVVDVLKDVATEKYWGDYDIDVFKFMNLFNRLLGREEV